MRVVAGLSGASTCSALAVSPGLPFTGGEVVGAQAAVEGVGAITAIQAILVGAPVKRIRALRAKGGPKGSASL